MIAFKACPRCHGDLLGSHEGEFSCLQCGRELGPEESRSLIVKLDANRRQPVLAA